MVFQLPVLTGTFFKGGALTAMIALTSGMGEYNSELHCLLFCYPVTSIFRPCCLAVPLLFSNVESHQTSRDTPLATTDHKVTSQIAADLTDAFPFLAYGSVGL